MQFEKKESQILKEVIETSEQTILLTKLCSSIQLNDDQVLKNFVMWSLIEKSEDGRGVSCRHRVHSNWNPDDKNSMRALCRGLLISIIGKVGLDKVQEILTEMKMGIMDDTQDHIN